LNESVFSAAWAAPPGLECLPSTDNVRDPQKAAKDCEWLLRHKPLSESIAHYGYERGRAATTSTSGVRRRSRTPDTYVWGAAMNDKCLAVPLTPEEG